LSVPTHSLRLNLRRCCIKLRHIWTRIQSLRSTTILAIYPYWLQVIFWLADRLLHHRKSQYSMSMRTAYRDGNLCKLCKSRFGALDWKIICTYCKIVISGWSHRSNRMFWSTTWLLSEIRCSPFWELARIMQVHPDWDRLVRIMTLHIANSQYKDQ